MFWKGKLVLEEEEKGKHSKEVVDVLGEFFFVVCEGIDGIFLFWKILHLDFLIG